MANLISIELTRACDAVQVPSGNPVTLPQGTPVDITQNLGGTITIRAQTGLFQIAGKDADALGLEVPEAAAGSRPANDRAPGSIVEVTEVQVWDVLKSCFDPEIPVNIVDLGLIYDLRLQPLASGWSKIEVKMTLTAPGCGMGGVIAQDAQQKLLRLDGVEEASVEVVWDPPWHQSMITPAGRKALGIE